LLPTSNTSKGMAQASQKVTLEGQPDCQIFPGAWTVRLIATTPQAGAQITPEGLIPIIVNFFVLGFLCGERTLHNIAPALLPVIELTRGVLKEPRSPSGLS
jgi:hypothetical protein